MMVQVPSLGLTGRQKQTLKYKSEPSPAADETWKWRNRYSVNWDRTDKL
jgi:hypothetical protein